MARCKYLGCRITIERVTDQTMLAVYGVDWSAVEADRPYHCPGGGSDGQHVPAKPVTVERHPGDAAHGDAPWCEVNDECLPGSTFAEYLVDGTVDSCGKCLPHEIDRRTIGT